MVCELELLTEGVKARREGKNFWIVEHLVSGSRITIRYPMEVRFSKWYHDSVAVERGSLVYALKNGRKLGKRAGMLWNC